MGVLLLVIVVWVVIGGGALVKVRTDARLASVEGFQRQLRSFGGGLPPLPESPGLGPLSDRSTIGHAPVIAALQGRPGRDRSKLLRRILACLLAAAAVSLVFALLTSTRVAWAVHLLVDNAVLAYVALLVRRRDALPGSGGRLGTATTATGVARNDMATGVARDDAASDAFADDGVPEVRLLPPDGAEGSAVPGHGGHLDLAVARVS